MICTNLKYWKVGKKKSSGKCIGFPENIGSGPRGHAARTACRLVPQPKTRLGTAGQHRARGPGADCGREDAAGPARKAKPAAISRPATVAQQGHDQDPAPAGHQAFGARGP